MIPYSLEQVVTQLDSNEAAAQGLLEAYTGRVIPKKEALKLFARIPDHKWYLSERLGRDVGARVAAVDLVENFYEPRMRKPSALQKFVKNTGNKIGSWAANYFAAHTGLPQ